MIWIRAIRFGFLKLRGRLFLTAVLYLTGFLLATLAVRPLSRGFHVTLDDAPAAADFLAGAGADLLAELGVNQPGFWAAAFSLVFPLLALNAVVGLFLTAGVYGVAAGAEGPTWRAFLPKAARFFWPFLGLLLLNLVFWALASALVGLGVAGLWRGFKGATDPGVHWRLFLVTAGVVALTANLFRNGVGFAQARYVLTGGSEGFGRCFLRALAFTFRRFVPVNALTWLLNALRGGALLLALFILAPGFATAQARFATALLLQAIFLWAAFLRVVEAGAQVEYQRGFLPPAEERPREALPTRTPESVEPPAPGVEEGILDAETDPAPAGPEKVDSGEGGA